jgi:hypothetical protein
MSPRQQMQKRLARYTTAELARISPHRRMHLHVYRQSTHSNPLWRTDGMNCEICGAHCRRNMAAIAAGAGAFVHQDAAQPA